VSGSATIGRVAGGTTTIGGLAAIGTMASGTVTLTGSTATITTLSAGRVVIGGSQVTVAGGTFAGTLSGSAGSLVKAGGGTLVLAGSNGFSADTSVRGGTLRLDAADALVASRVSVLAGGTLSIAPRLSAALVGLAPNAGGLIDVTDGAITVAAGLSAPDVLTAITTGLGDGTWNGTSGITSSAAAAAPGGSRGVGWLDNGDGSVTFAYAAAGDSNLDWFVDILDAANFLAAGAYDAGFGSSWNDGDYTYDTLVDILDAASFLSTGLFDAGGYNDPSPAAVAAVPEPSAAVVVAIAGLMTVAVARRRF
jgi:autotransporter-associated beta strand protein